MSLIVGAPSPVATTREAAGAGSLDGSPGPLPEPPRASGAPGTSQAAADLTLSAAARLLVAVLAAGDEPPPVRAPVPLLQDPGVPAGELAGALRDAVVSSGLFYESHLAAFAQGLLSREELARMPQALHAACTPGESRRALPASDEGLASAGRALTQADPSAPGGIDAALLPIVHQQLELLASGVFRWSGEAWPGVPMQWTIERHAPDERETGQEQEGEPQRRWATRILIELPAIGAVQARLALEGARLHTLLQASGPGAAALEEQVSQLRHGLARHGLVPHVDIDPLEGTA